MADCQFVVHVWVAVRQVRNDQVRLQNPLHDLDRDDSRAVDVVGSFYGIFRLKDRSHDVLQNLVRLFSLLGVLATNRRYDEANRFRYALGTEGLCSICSCHVRISLL
jgi:hypothetical protein